MSIKHLSLITSVILSIFCCVHLNASAQTDVAKKFRLLPQPQKVEWLKGRGLAYRKLRSINLVGNARKPILFDELDHLPISSAQGPGTLKLVVSSTEDFSNSREGYRLEISNDEVVIVAKEVAGLFYGCQTLQQLIEDARDQHIDIPACKIVDFPELSFRAVHLDLKHHLETGDNYYRMIDRLARIKVNAIIVEFEDKLRYRKAPLVGASNAISVEEFAAITRYARERNIEINPLVQGLGHASFILKHEKYKELRDNPISDWVFDPLNPETYELQFALYEDAIDATPGGKYLHVGGDEVGSLGFSERSKKSGMKPFELQMFWLKKVCDFAKAHNRIPIFWDDMIFNLSGLYETTYIPSIPDEEVIATWKANEPRLDSNIHLFPENCVFMRWSYGMQILGERKAVDWYKRHNINMMTATAAQTMWPMLPRLNSNFLPIKDLCKLSTQKKIDGILCTVWDDTSPHQETVWRGLNYFAMLSWNYEDVSLEQANVIFRHRFYSPALVDSSAEFQDRLEEGVTFWETALLDNGRRSNYPDSIDLIDLPQLTNSGSWRKKYQKRLQQARLEIANYTEIKKRIEKAQKLALRNRYSLEVMYQVNELQIYASRILVLLEQFDLASSEGLKTDRRKQLQQLVEDFPRIRENMERVYRATRSLDKPEDYLLDKNFHQHLANGTINTDWMFVYELAINKAISNWQLN